MNEHVHLRYERLDECMVGKTDRLNSNKKKDKIYLLSHYSHMYEDYR